ncbi:MAG: family 43 glycosylhydrolase [Steroidobacteraceae bacterium]
MSSSREWSRRAVLHAAAAGGASLLLRPPGLLARAGTRDPGTSAGVSINDRMAGAIAPVHDPCLIKAGGTYYLYGTSMPGGPGVTLHTSPDLVHWTSRGAIFNAIPSWALALVPGTRGMWAPDVSRFSGGYRLYYAVSTFGSNRSVIGLATNTTLDRGATAYLF